MSNIFERDYQMLDLGRDANWQEAQENYRRLVNRWHPDRFTDRPRERQLAQSRFIDVTKSYNNLRNFHRENRRLPLQNPSFQDFSPSQSTGTPPEPTKKPGKYGSATVEEEFFAQQGEKPSKKRPYWLWVIPLIGLFGVVLLFLELEKRVAEQTRENAIEVLRSTEPSEFMPKK